MRFILVIKVVLSLLLSEPRFIFIEGKNIELSSSSCNIDGKYMVCEGKQGENKIEVEVTGDCKGSYWVIQANWEEGGMMQTQIVELQKQCILMFPLMAK